MSGIISAFSGGGGSSPQDAAASGLSSFSTTNYRSMGLGALQAGSTSLGILGSLGAANAKAGAYRMAGQEAEADAGNQLVIGGLQQGQEGVAGNAGVGRIKKQLFDTLSARTAAIGASGVDLGQGIATDSARTLASRAGDAMTAQGLDTAEQQTATGLNATMKSYRSRLTALQDNAQADSAERTGTLQALGSAGGLLLSFLGRG